MHDGKRPYEITAGSETVIEIILLIEKCKSLQSLLLD